MAPETAGSGGQDRVTDSAAQHWATYDRECAKADAEGVERPLPPLAPRPTTAATVHGVWEGEYEADLACLHGDLASAMACAADAERHNGRYVEVHEHRVETAGDHE